MAVNHPGFYNARKEVFTYERRKESQFYIPNTEGKLYYQGCFNGGKSNVFLEMSQKLADMIDIDLWVTNHDKIKHHKYDAVSKCCDFDEIYNKCIEKLNV
jgi:hypothetical protein